MEFGLKAMPDPSRIKRNPFYDRIMKEGFTVIEYYSPEDIKNIESNLLALKVDLTTLDDEEMAAMEEYRKNQTQTAQ